MNGLENRSVNETIIKVFANSSFPAVDFNVSWFSLYLAKKLNFRCSSMYAFELSILCKCFEFQIVAKTSKNCILIVLWLLQSQLNMGEKNHSVLITYVKDILRVILTGLIKYSFRDASILLFYPS